MATIFLFFFQQLSLWLIIEPLYFTQMCTDTRVKNTEITGSLWEKFLELIDQISDEPGCYQDTYFIIFFAKCQMSLGLHEPIFSW